MFKRIGAFCVLAALAGTAAGAPGAAEKTLEQQSSSTPTSQSEAKAKPGIFGSTKPYNIETAKKALEVIKAECPGLERIMTRPTNITVDISAHTTGADQYGWRFGPQKPFGWSSMMLISVEGPGGIHAIYAGYGSTPAIAVWRRGGFQGTRLCRLDRFRDRFHYKRVKGLEVLKALKD